jgi:hypothetical protein
VNVAAVIGGNAYIHMIAAYHRAVRIPQIAANLARSGIYANGANRLSNLQARAAHRFKGFALRRFVVRID